MIKYIFWFWFFPMTLFWSWFGLSYYDINFGMAFLSRDAHNLVFGIYANLLGVSYETIVRGFIKAIFIDSAVIGLIVAFRRRKAIKAWWIARRESRNTKDQPRVLPAE